MTILEDEREIELITFEGPDEPMFKVGLAGCTAIRAYGEPSQYCNVPWFAVYCGDEIKHRVPAGQVCVTYK